MVSGGATRPAVGVQWGIVRVRWRRRRGLHAERAREVLESFAIYN
jgi:hypothetical protein